ncbi:MAG: hypothetical protein LBC48_06510 [Dysgonamonadaceae bacterium]|nr:hypothetical protein [Dysgonamonadaceae bacterium]
MKNLKKLVFFTLMLAFGASSAYSQVRISDLDKPAAGAVLDLKSLPGGYVGGLLLPNVKIIDISDIPDSFISRNKIKPAELAGLIVYNAIESNGIPKGVYVWNGTKWVKIN